MNNKILNKCYKNYLKASNNYYSDTWKATSSQNIEFFKKKNLFNMLTNNNIRGLAPIDNYPAYDYLDKASTKELKDLQKKEYFDIYKKNKYLNSFYGSSYTIAYRYFLNIKNLINKESYVLVIGDGLGILSSIILKKIQCKIFLCDLPETLVYQEFFLRNNLKTKKFQYIANNKDSINFSNQITFINADQLKRLKIKLNLVINTDSFGEMDKISVNNYFDYASKNLISEGFFYYCNPVGLSGASYENPGQYPLDNSFDIKKIEIFYPSHRDTFCKYLSLTAQKKNTYNYNFIRKNLSIKQSIITKYYNESEKIFFKKESEELSNLVIKISNKISSQEEILKEDKKKFNSLLKKKKFKKGLINFSVFYHYAFLKIMQYFKSNKRNKVKKYINLILGAKKRDIENTCVVKIASLVRFIDLNSFYKILNKIPENFFEIVFLKFFLYEGIDFRKQKSLFNKILKFKTNYFFDYLKLFYCASKIKNTEVSKSILIRIKKKINNKDNAISFLKILFLLANFQLFINFFKIYEKKYKITQNDLQLIFLSTNFLNKNTHKLFKDYYLTIFQIQSKKDNSLQNLIVRFKLGILSEKYFMKNLTNKYQDYYSIGFVLKNTLNFLSKESVIKLSKKSLNLRKTPQNINFIAEVYFYNSLYKEASKALELIKNVENYSVFYALKKYLSDYAKKNIYNKLIVEKLISLDFFKMIHNGRVTILPFLCTGNNAVQFNGNKL